MSPVRGSPFFHSLVFLTNEAMNQSYNFVGQHLFGQILSLSAKYSLAQVIQRHQSDRCYKQLKTWDHYVAMMYAVMAGCTSLREIVLGLESFEGKLNHLNIDCAPARSTLSDGNKKRDATVFKGIYHHLYDRYKPFLSDSTLPKHILENLFLMDSSVFQLFKEILKTSGRPATDGRKKGGIKKNTVIHGASLMPVLIQFSAAAMNDQQFYQHLQLSRGSYIVFDKGYNNYMQFARFSEHGVFFVTRQKENATYVSTQEFEPKPGTPDQVLKDEAIAVTYKDETGKSQTLSLRRVAWWVENENKVYEFITNNFELEAQTIAQLYRYRWKIELFFKKLKQNFPLEYFVGDNQNAIEIQIWCALIALLLITVIHHQHKSKLAFSVMVSILRQHLFNYIAIKSLLDLANKTRSRTQQLLADLFGSA